ncbi:MAG: ribbon-helix-helix protein, CopG family [Vicinamibacteria bacterium]
MKQLLVELEDELADRLEEIAPGRSRRRSEFIRRAIRKAIWELEEQATAEAYARLPDVAKDVYVDPAVWEAPSGERPSRRKK